MVEGERLSYAYNSRKRGMTIEDEKIEIFDDGNGKVIIGASSNLERLRNRFHYWLSLNADKNFNLEDVRIEQMRSSDGTCMYRILINTNFRSINPT